MKKNQKFPLNRRLKKIEVKEIIEEGAILNEEYSKEFYEKYWNGNEEINLVYDLPNGDFLFVFSSEGDSIKGKGNYYERESFLRMLRWRKKVFADYANGRGSSVDHWKSFTKQGAKLIENKELNLSLISEELKIEPNSLDYSYESLGLIDKQVNKYPYGDTWKVLYDCLVYYVGEIIKIRVGGTWKINESPMDYDFPSVTVTNSDLNYMPINIVWEQIDGLNDCNLRKATADEIRINAYLHPKNNKQ
jgi:hypothetical protein